MDMIDAIDVIVNTDVDKLVNESINNMRNHSRYPYTYANDFIREVVGVGSRADASNIIQEYAEKNNLSHFDVACKLADIAIIVSAFSNIPYYMKVAVSE